MKVKFAHMQYERHIYDYQGAQIPLIGWDELTHFSSTQFFYLLSRNRSVGSVTPYVRATCNPDPDSWLATFLSWWIDQDTGYAIEEHAGILRWFIRDGDELIWSETKHELQTKLAETNPLLRPKSVTFIPSSVHDNQILLETNPEYLSNLQALPLVDRERLLNGNWKIRPSAGKVFNRAWFTILPVSPGQMKLCRFWDFAATEKKLKGKQPDYTATVLMGRWGNNFYILDAQQWQEDSAKIDKYFYNITQQDYQYYVTQGGCEYMVQWEQEPAAAGKKENRRLASIAMNAVPGINARGIKPDGDKIVRAKGMSAQAEAGNIYVIAGNWNEMLLSHLHAQPDYPHDDLFDASSGSFRALASPAVSYVPTLGVK
jgi:predicted phage terminase large subunit-like protein